MDAPPGIYRRPDSQSWWATYTDASGKATRRSCRIAIADDPHGIQAAALRAQWIRESAAPAPATATIGETFDDVCDAYLDHLGGRCRPRSMNRYLCAVRKLQPVFTGLALDAISKQDVKAYIRARRATVGPSTVNAEITFMSGMYRWAVDELDLELNMVWERRSQTIPPPRNRWLTQDECRRLLDAARQLTIATYMPDWIALGLNTGMRPDELSSLTWDRVDLERGIITFDASNSKNKRPATIPINATARMALLSRQAIQRQRGTVSPYVFTTHGGHRMMDISKAFNNAVAAAGLHDVHPHDLRRTFASHLVQAGIPIQTVSGLLRHSDITVTHRVYAYLSPEQYRSATAVLDAPPALKIVSERE